MNERRFLVTQTADHLCRVSLDDERDCIPASLDWLNLLDQVGWCMLLEQSRQDLFAYCLWYLADRGIVERIANCCASERAGELADSVATLYRTLGTSESAPENVARAGRVAVAHVQRVAARIAQHKLCSSFERLATRALL